MMAPISTWKELNTVIVKRITYGDTKPFLLEKHYLRRMPSISFAFGLFIDDVLEGVLTVGKPASVMLGIGICGELNKDYVYELNRLVVNENSIPNLLSQFVSKALKLLSHEGSFILVSYADTAMGHSGYIYQATNWLFTGSTVKRTDRCNENGDHPRHGSGESTHRKERSSKHRYVTFVGKESKYLRSCLNYEIKDFPKGENQRYEFGDGLKENIWRVKGT